MSLLLSQGLEISNIIDGEAVSRSQKCKGNPGTLLSQTLSYLTSQRVFLFFIAFILFVRDFFPLPGMNYLKESHMLCPLHPHVRFFTQINFLFSQVRLGLGNNILVSLQFLPLSSLTLLNYHCTPSSLGCTQTGKCFK